MHAKGNCLDPVIARITAREQYRHAIGFSVTESTRARKDALYNSRSRTGWYPLIEWGWSRADCDEYVRGILGETIKKSACSFCPFAMTTQAGRANLINRYRDEPEAAAAALYIEHVARSLNPTQTLIAGGSAADLVVAAGLTEAINRFRAKLEAADYAIYEVRRLTRPGKQQRRGITARSIRIIASGSHADMTARLSAMPGHRTTRPDGIVRHIRRERSRDGVDHLYVCAPAGVEPKQRPGFEEWWQEATNDALF